MQLTSFALSALFASSALAQATVKTHVVRVGSMTGELTFMPSTLVAAQGDMVQFQFAPKNHTVTQSTFDQPCQPAALHSNITGIYSGYMPVAADAQMTATWTVMLNDTKPLWLYCSQGKHCQGGMVMVINPPAANQSRTFETYKALAAQSTVNLPGDSIGGGSSNGTTPSNGGGSSNGGSDGSAGGATSVSPDTPLNTSPGSGASGLRVGGAAGLGGVLAIVFALFL